MSVSVSLSLTLGGAGQRFRQLLAPILGETLGGGQSFTSPLTVWSMTMSSLPHRVVRLPLSLFVRPREFHGLDPRGTQGGPKGDPASKTVGDGFSIRPSLVYVDLCDRGTGG